MQTFLNSTSEYALVDTFIEDCMHKHIFSVNVRIGGNYRGTWIYAYNLCVEGLCFQSLHMMFMTGLEIYLRFHPNYKTGKSFSCLCFSPPARAFSVRVPNGAQIECL